MNVLLDTDAFLWSITGDDRLSKTAGETFLNPEADPLQSGYHILQSKIAVGSGLTFGKGYLNGTQGHLDFLPERHTDFAFSIWAEEWGFTGSLFFLAIYFSMILRASKPCLC